MSVEEEYLRRIAISLEDIAKILHQINTQLVNIEMQLSMLQ